MADQDIDGGRQRGNRPAENAKQATPGSLAAQLNWQGGSAAQDFLGLNEDPHAPAEPTAAAKHVPRGAPTSGVSQPGDQSWLMSDDEPRAAPAPRPEQDPAESDAAEPDDVPETHAFTPSARAAAVRAPSVLDASWTEPRVEKRASKRPLLVALCVAGVLGVGGYVYMSPATVGSRPDAATELAAAPATKPAVRPNPASSTQPIGGPAAASAADAASLREAPAAEPELVLEAPTPAEAPKTVVPPVAAYDFQGRAPVDFSGQAVREPVEEAPPTSEPVTPPAAAPLVAEAPALEPEPASAPAVATPTAPSPSPTASPEAAPTASPEAAPTASTELAPRARAEPTVPSFVAPAQPAAEPRAPAPTSRPRFQAPGAVAEKPAGSSTDVARAEPPVASIGPAAPPVRPTAEPVETAPKSVANSAPETVPPVTTPANPGNTPGAPTPQGEPAAPLADVPTVRVLGSTTKTVPDGSSRRPAVDEHPSAVPTVPPSTAVADGAKPAEPDAAPLAKAPAPPGAPIPVPQGTQGPVPQGTGQEVAAAPAPATPHAPAAAAPPAHETREGTLPPAVVLLPGKALEGVRAAEGKDLDGVWTGDTVPLDRVSNKTKLLTPRVGDVRVTLKSKDVFEGRLYAVGENTVWIEGPFGRLGLSHERVASVDKVVQETAVGVGVDARVRIKTPSGPLLGRVTAVEGTKLKVVTDSGLKFTVEAKDAEPVVEAPRIVVKQAPKQG